MIRTSDKIDQIASSINQLQKQVLEIEKSEENPFFKSKFAPIENSWRKLREPLTMTGLSIVQFPSLSNGIPCLTTRLMHISGQYMEADYLLNPSKNDPQGMAGAITFARRNALNAITGIVACGEDVDGNDAIINPQNVTAAAPGNAGEYIIPVGRDKGRKVKDLSAMERDGATKYWEDRARKENRTLTGDVATYVAACKQYAIDVVSEDIDFPM